MLYPPKHSAWRVAYRYLSGRPLDGQRRTDCGYLRPGTVVKHDSGHASRWAHRPGWYRQAWRLGTPTAVGTTLYLHHLSPDLTDAGLLALGSYGAGTMARRTVRRVKLRRVNRRYTQPLAAVLAGVLKMPTDRADWVYIPPALTADIEPGLLDRVALPGWLHTPRPIARLTRRVRRALPRAHAEGWIKFPTSLPVGKEVRAAVADALSMKVHDDLDIVWHGRGDRPHVAFSARPRPPAMVGFSDIRDAIEATGDAAPIIGCSAAGPFSIDLDSDAPHIGASCGSGAGKSVLLRGLIAQWLHQGTQVLILDNKRVSQSWCKDLPGVRYCRTGEELHNALLEMAAEVDRRFDLIDAVPAAEEEDRVDVGPRVVIVFEEQNIGMQALAQYWAEVRPQGAPKRSPAMVALDKVLCAGRQCRMHVFSVAQMFTVASTGGNPAARENYGVRILARATRNAWMMLAPECGPPFPKTSKRRGRMHVVLAGEATEVQVAWWTVKEARAWATADADVTVPAGWDTRSGLRDSARAVTSERFYTLAEAAREDWCRPSYDALRQAASRGKRAGTWPAGRTVSGIEKWTKAELEAAITKRSDAVLEGDSR